MKYKKDQKSCGISDTSASPPHLMNSPLGLRQHSISPMTSSPDSPIIGGGMLLAQKSPPAIQPDAIDNDNMQYPAEIIRDEQSSCPYPVSRDPSFYNTASNARMPMLVQQNNSSNVFMQNSKNFNGQPADFRNNFVDQKSLGQFGGHHQWLGYQNFPQTNGQSQDYQMLTSPPKLTHL